MSAALVLNDEVETYHNCDIAFKISAETPCANLSGVG